MIDRKYHLEYIKKWNVYPIFDCVENKVHRQFQRFSQATDHVIHMLGIGKVMYDQVTVSKTTMKNKSNRDYYFDSLGEFLCKHKGLPIVDLTKKKDSLEAKV